MMYICNLCNFSTKIKTQYKTHQETKKHKKNEENYGLNIGKKSTNEHKKSKSDHKKSTNDDKNYRCEYCSKVFKTKANMKRHQKSYCKLIGKNNSNKIDNKIKTIEDALMIQQKNHDKEKKFLFKQIEVLLTKVGNTTINNTQNIQLNNYGKEDMSHISDSLKTQLLKIPYGMIPKFIEAVHFSDKKPENKNIALTNKNDNKIKIFTGSKWVYKNKDDTINDLVDGKYFILDTHFDNCHDDLNIQTKNNYEKFRNFFDDGDKKILEQIKNDSELVLLNNR